MLEEGKVVQCKGWSKGTATVAKGVKIDATLLVGGAPTHPSVKRGYAHDSEKVGGGSDAVLRYWDAVGPENRVPTTIDR